MSASRATVPASPGAPWHGGHAGHAGPDLLAGGEVIARTYCVVDVIGQGGMAQVYEARDLMLERTVAIKVPWPHVEPDLVRAEAKALAGLWHPSVVALYGSGMHRGIDYLVMERLFGLTLRDHMQARQSEDQPLALVEALSTLSRIADALAYIHKQGVIHRDLKPENIILEPRRGPVLVDFGLTRKPTRDTRMISGSPHYMAPEVITGGGDAALGVGVDIYALGVIAFEMLVGRKPFDGTPLAVISKHLSDRPLDVHGQRRDVSPELATLIAEMMAKHAEDRPRSAAAVGMRLHALRQSMRGAKEVNPE